MSNQLNLDALQALELLPADARAASANGAAIDVRGYTGTMKVTLSCEAGTGTNPTADVKIQSSANGSSGWADITGAAFTQVTDAAAAFESIHVQTRETAGYIRAVATLAADDTPGFVCSVTAVAAKKSA